MAYVGIQPRIARSAALVAVALLCGCEDALRAVASQTSTTSGYDCIVDDVVVDPDDLVRFAEAGCEIELEVQAFGPGGAFDVFSEDDAGGSGSAWDYPVSVRNGDRFVVGHRFGDALPPEVKVYVAMYPHSPNYACTGRTEGAAGSKILPRADAARDCVVTFRVADEIDLGEIRIAVDYSASDGEFPGCRGAVACEPLRGESGAFQAGPFDDDGNRKLTLRTSSARGFSAPVDVYRCDLFKPVGAGDPSPEDFVVMVESGRTPPPLSKPLAILPSVEVSVDCEFGPTTTTTLDFVPAECGRPCSPEADLPRARDALFVLQAAVDTVSCKTCICDVNRSGAVDATDALAVIARAVGLDVLLRCVDCAAAVSQECE